MRHCIHFRSLLLLLIVSFMLLGCRILFADNADVLGLYDEAIAQTARASYKAEIANVRFGDLPDIAKATYFRKVEDDGFVMLRADLHDRNGQLEWTLLKNRDGQFAVNHPHGKTAQGGSFLRLFYLESMMNRPVSEGLLRYAEMSLDNVRFKGRPCTKITIRFPKDIDKEGGPPLRWMTGMPPGMSYEEKERIPFVREVFIDKASGIILAIRKFNERGKMFREMSLGDVAVNPDWSKMPGLFDSPPKPDYYVGNLYQFRQFLRELPPSGASRPKNGWTQIWHKLRNVLEGRLGIWIFGGIAVVCLVGATLARRRQFRE